MQIIKKINNYEYNLDAGNRPILVSTSSAHFLDPVKVLL